MRRPAKRATPKATGAPGAAEVLAALAKVIHERRDADPAESYTARLLASGVVAIGAKLIEEVHELVEAATLPEDPPARRAALVHEAADVLFHALVLLESRAVSLNEVLAELAVRFGRSGLAEKASRKPT